MRLVKAIGATNVFREHRIKNECFKKALRVAQAIKSKINTPVQHQKGHTYGRATMAGMTCTARGNLAACIRKVKERRKCKFCGKRSVDLYHCNACGEYFCLKSPTQLIIPGSNPPRHFRIVGPFFWHLVHGYSNWNECAP